MRVSRRPSLAVALLLALGLMTAACGARLEEAEREKAVAAAGGRGGGGAGGADGAADTTGGEAASDTTGATDDGGTTGGATGGTTGGTAGGTTGAVGAACRPGSATSTGVTATEVKVGNVSQLTGLVPGFGQTSVNGIKAYFNYINSRGGVCGRKLTLVQSDDRFQSATNRTETDKLSDDVVAFAGSLSVVDDGGAAIINTKKIADVSVATTESRTASAYNFSPNPVDPSPSVGNGQDKVLTYLKQSRGISKGAIFYQDVATGVNQSRKYELDLQQAGIQVVAKYAVAPTATNFRSQATDMKQKGIDVVITVAEINAISNLARAFDDVGYKPKAPFYGAQTYSQRFLKLAGPAAEGTVAGMIFHVPEEGTPAMQTFSQWYQRTAPGADVDFFSVLGWVAGEMVARAIGNAGPDPTQAKVVAELQKFTNYESEYVAPINPAQKRITNCFLVLEVKGGKWTKIHPAGSGFACP
jgi:ABC-type branched-subunit amino acid transport system substrate-binding protein